MFLEWYITFLTKAVMANLL